MKAWQLRETLGRKGRQALGPKGMCVCTACSYSEPHETGVPCDERKCPKCGAEMRREET